jgi:hypothetical protein
LIISTSKSSLLDSLIELIFYLVRIEKLPGTIFLLKERLYTRIVFSSLIINKGAAKSFEHVLLSVEVIINLFVDFIENKRKI